MDEEQIKKISERVPFVDLDQVHSDFALALALQEQEGALTMFTTIETESEDDDEDTTSGDNYDDSDYDFLESQEIEAELELLEEEEDGNSDDEEMEEDDIDPDLLSYEELIALGEIVGEENRGLSLAEISSFLRPCSSQTVNCTTVIDRCVICQVEYEEGENLVSLSCDHQYHSDCISEWLQIKKTCPICGTEVSSPKIATIG